MTHRPFGWSYPPGCSGPPYDGGDPSELVENVLDLLEDADVPTEINDQIVKLIETWEDRKIAEDDARIQLWPEDEETPTQGNDK